MKYHVLASGSKGNSIFIYDQGNGLLIDCGISKRQLYTKLNQLGFHESDIHHVLLTHDHIDHNKNIGIFDQSIVYCGKGCLPGIDESHELENYQNIQLDHYIITPLPLSHDATSPLGFVIKGKDETILYMTDTGYVSQKNMEYIKNLDYYIFESNHDVNRLMQTKRPMFLKQRILSDSGHLNNEDSSLNLTSLINAKTKNIVLAHLSEEANTQDLALDTFSNVLLRKDLHPSGIDVRAAKQFEILTIE